MGLWIQGSASVGKTAFEAGGRREVIKLHVFLLGFNVNVSDIF